MILVNAIILPLALIIDRVKGDPQSRFHPVVLIGQVIGWWGRPAVWPGNLQRAAGVVMWFCTVFLFALPSFIVGHYLPWFLLLIIGPVLLKFCLAWRSLEEHTRSVSEGITRSIDDGRREVAKMVSRTTDDLNDEQILSAAYESLAENLVDSIISPVFYFAIFGLAGAAVFRVANTLDAMLGYHDERERIGWFSARMDDFLNFIPARITGGLLLLYFAAKGRFLPAYEALKWDRKKRPGLNGGIPMAIIAGGTGIRFEKPGVYVMGTGERSLREGGAEIIEAVQVVTLTFTLTVMMVLILLGSETIYTGI
jgi:adenosylcobinamide-phosphate synthase